MRLSLPVDPLCRRCDRCLRRDGAPVPASGPFPARLALVAWAAEADDDLLGEPLSGPGGLRLRRALQEAGIDPASLLLTLVVRCAGKTVRAGHRDACRPWLDAELEAARPAAVVALGVEVARLLTGDRTLVLADHLGQALVVPDAPYRIIPWYAPAGILSGGGRYRSTVELFQRLVQEYA